MKKPEILAPAGSMEALKAAVTAGADAVYLGGNRFGARAYADNFDEQTLIEAIEYCHIYGVKVYLTINTLFRNEEIYQLKDFLLPLYRAGLDAVIVQDLGVMLYVHTVFPDIDIHASTQMTITSSYAYQLLKQYGVTRIVPARELSLKELAGLKQDIDYQPEVEVFVQGALCYCYSGQCLFSSFLGGRSGNRGRCAQPCRLPYELIEESGHKNKVGDYLLSPKDLCGLSSIPDLIKAGVDSFKIEGRMKSSSYVAACVLAYRTCVDAWFDGTFNNDLVDRWTRVMASTFNRGGFTQGYFGSHNGKHMMSTYAPNNAGVEIGLIEKVLKNQIQVRLKDRVSPKDVFVIRTKNEEVTLTCNVLAQSGDIITLNIPKNARISMGQSVSRVRCSETEQLILPYLETDRDIHISGTSRFCIGEQCELTISTQVDGVVYEGRATGGLVENASKQPVTKELLVNKLSQTGGTRYIVDHIHVDLAEYAFVPMKELKELRRNAIRDLECRIIEASRRTQEVSQEDRIDDYEVASHPFESQAPVVTMVSTTEQLEVIMESRLDCDIYLDLQFFGIEDIMHMVKDTQHRFYLVLPAIMRQSCDEDVKAAITYAKECVNYNGSEHIHISGIVIRTIDELSLLISMNYKGQVIFDYNMYAMNKYAKIFYGLIAQHHFSGYRFTMPVELNKNQMLDVGFLSDECELIVYGYQQLMVSAQCLTTTVHACNRKNDRFVIKDRYGKEFPTQSVCKYCYSLIYNSVPTDLCDLDMNSFLNKLPKRFHFTIENADMVRNVLNQSFNGNSVENRTKGHFARGVE